MSIVGRGLGRKATDAALLVTAGLGRGQRHDDSFGGDDMPALAPRRIRRTDDELFDIALALVMSGALDS